MVERFAKWRWVLGLALVGLPVVLIALPLFQYAENLHTVEESTTFDRLTLGMRTFWATPASSMFRPSTWRVDTNFPLGTALLYGLPKGLGLPPVLVGRLLSTLAAVVASLAAFRILAPRFGPILAGFAAAVMWAVPAFARGAVLSGEEALFTASLLVALLGLVEGGRWLILAVIGANAAVAFRLDAMVVLPGLALAAIYLHGIKRGLLFSFLSGLSSVAHLGAAWLTTGDPLSFAKLARGVTAATTRDGGLTDSVEFVVAASQNLPSPWMLPLAIAGLAVCVWRGDRRGRAWALVAVWVTGAYLVVGAMGILKLQFVRYTVPMLAMLSASSVLVLFGARGRARAVGHVAAALLLILALLAGSERAVAEASVARNPAGLEQASHWLAMCRREGTVIATSHAPAITILGPIAPYDVDLLQTKFNWLDPRDVGEQLSAPAARFLVLVGGSAVVQEARQARVPGWRFVWQENAVTIYTRAEGEEYERLLACTRW